MSVYIVTATAAIAVKLLARQNDSTTCVTNVSPLTTTSTITVRLQISCFEQCLYCRSFVVFCEGFDIRLFVENQSVIHKQLHMSVGYMLDMTLNHHTRII